MKLMKQMSEELDMYEAQLIANGSTSFVYGDSTTYLDVLVQTILRRLTGIGHKEMISSRENLNAYAENNNGYNGSAPSEEFDIELPVKVEYTNGQVVKCCKD